MTLPEPFQPRGEHFAINLPRVTALFTTRRGGHSSGPYASLNLGRMTGDDPEAVARNREALRRQTGAAELRFVRQVHGTRVVEVDGAGPVNGADPLPEADGLVTGRRGVALAVQTADCLPIVVAGGSAVAVLHAGWRGLAAGVIEAGVGALRSAGGDRELVAAIGPGAGPCCYGVGAEVLRAFADHPAAIHEAARVDLKAIAAERLRGAGVAEVHDAALCTICSPDLLFSHRRDRGATGRQAGVAWLN